MEVVMHVCSNCSHKSNNDCDWSHLPTMLLELEGVAAKKCCTYSTFSIIFICICEVSIMMEAGLEDVKDYVVGW